MTTQAPSDFASPASQPAAGAAPPSAADLLAVGFGISVAMWAVGYLGRVFTQAVPAPVLLAGMLLCLLGGGWVLGRHGRRGVGRGAAVGLIAGLVNLLILGSLLGGQDREQMMRSAAVWIPGSLLLSMALAAAGAAAGHRGALKAPAAARDAAAAGRWTFFFAVVAAVATFNLVIAGGLVTGMRAGLSVPDWPNSFQMNMFLYPLSRMTGGVYYEHAHRLYGTLVGLTTLVLAGHLWRTERRRWVCWLALVAVLAVIAQGVVGGFRVTEAHTGQGIEFSAPEDETALSISLAVAHGTFGQVFLGLMVALAAVSSPRWRRAEPPRPAWAAATDFLWSFLAVAALLVQLLLGAVQRHTQGALLLHIAFACITAIVVVVACVRAWGLYPDQPIVRKLGLWGLGLLTLQILLGVAALVAINGHLAVDAAITTLHQAVGAGLLAQAVLLAAWERRLLAPAGPTPSARAALAVPGPGGPR